MNYLKNFLDKFVNLQLYITGNISHYILFMKDPLNRIQCNFATCFYKQSRQNSLNRKSWTLENKIFNQIIIIIIIIIGKYEV